MFQVRSVYFPRELLRPSSLLTNIVLDDTRSSSSRLSSSCDNLFAYISDTVAPGKYKPGLRFGYYTIKLFLFSLALCQQNN